MLFCLKKKIEKEKKGMEKKKKSKENNQNCVPWGDGEVNDSVSWYRALSTMTQCETMTSIGT